MILHSDFHLIPSQFTHKSTRHKKTEAAKRFRQNMFYLKQVASVNPLTILKHYQLAGHVICPALDSSNGAASAATFFGNASSR